MNTFEHICNLLDTTGRAPHSRFNFVTKHEFEQWQQEYTFEALTYGTRYGQSFCNRFGIVDYLLYYDSTAIAGDTDDYIRQQYLVKK